MVEPPKRLMTKLCTSSARIHMSDSALESPWWVDAILALFSWIPVIMRGVGGRGGGCGSDVTSSSQKGRCTWFSFFMDNLLFFPIKTRTIVRRKSHYSCSSFQPSLVEYGINICGRGCGSDVTIGSQQGWCTWFSFFMNDLLFFPAKTRTKVRWKVQYAYSFIQPVE